MKNSKYFIIAVICLALLIPAMASAEKKRLVVGGKKKTEAPAAADKMEGSTITLQQFDIPLADEDADHSVKLVIALEFADEASAAQFAPKKAAVRDSVLSTVGVKKHSELKKVPDRMALRDVLKTKINEIFGAEIVLKVYFSDFVLQ